MTDKPFSYEDCKPHRDGKRRAVDREGRVYVLLCDDAAGKFPIVGHTNKAGRNGVETFCWMRSGMFCEGISDGRDLVGPAPRRGVTDMSPGVFDASKPFTTRDGRAVEQAVFDSGAIAGLVDGCAQTWPESGKHEVSHLLDLVNVPDALAPVPPAGGGEDFGALSDAVSALQELAAGGIDGVKLKRQHAVAIIDALSHRSSNPPARDEVIDECARVAERLASELVEEGELYCLRLAAEAIRALKQEPASDGWLPIDSAPKDGTDLLVAGAYPNEQGWVCEAWYDDEEFHEGWYVFNAHWTDASDGRVDPTHWRPLPAPPRAQWRIDASLPLFFFAIAAASSAAETSS